MATGCLTHNASPVPRGLAAEGYAGVRCAAALATRFNRQVGTWLLLLSGRRTPVEQARTGSKPRRGADSSGHAAGRTGNISGRPFATHAASAVYGICASGGAANIGRARPGDDRPRAPGGYTL